MERKIEESDSWAISTVLLWGLIVLDQLFSLLGFIMPILYFTSNTKPTITNIVVGNPLSRFH
ncbi:hypothetical protein [Peribacillus butanolivorans]|uniref:hypothetical protein n=1 Tax=Peribacillus butanolivorans TaxID=421767 RepID=UPI003830A5E2